MDHLPIDWKRVRGALFQDARRRGIPEERVERVLAVLPDLVDASGDYSRSRKVAVRVGSLLISSDVPHVIVPTCPAYPNRDGRYHRVWTLGSGVSLLTKLHVPFLERMAERLPGMRVTVLVADFEADDPIIRRATGLTRTAFTDRVRGTLDATRAFVRGQGWDAQLFSDFLPDFRALRDQAMEAIALDPAFRPQIVADTKSRQGFYRLYYPRGSFRQFLRRTTKAAAEYTVLGNEAAARGLLIVNHTTTSLAWYLRTEAAFLQNPVRTY